MDVLDLWYIGYFLFQLKGSENIKKMKRLNKEEVKQQLIDSLVNNDTIETEELNEKAEKVDTTEDVANIIKEYEEILRTKRASSLLRTIMGKCSVGFVKRKGL